MSRVLVTGGAGTIGAAVVRRLAGDPVAWSEASARCRAYAARAFDETRILAPYIDLVERLLQKDGPA